MSLGPQNFTPCPSAGLGQLDRTLARRSGLQGAFYRSLRSSWQSLASFVYVCRGRPIFAKGYRHYRDRFIQGVINDERKLQDFSGAKTLPEGYGVGLDERVVEYPWLLSKLSRLSHGARLLDAGSTLNYEMILQHRIVKRHKCTILTLAPEPQCFWKFGVSYLFEDLRSAPFKDEWFDAIACVSVIEHVGMDNAIYSKSNAHRESRPLDYLVAIRELKRIMKVGGSLFITVPFGTYEDHGWLQQFDSKRLASLITEFAPQKINKMFFRYTIQGWQFSREDACKDLSYFNAHACGGEMRVERKRPHDLAVAARGVACIELVK